MYMQCDMAEAVWKLVETVITSKPSQEQIPVMFLGGGCSVSTQSLAALTGQLYNATQVRYNIGVGGLSSAFEHNVC